MPNRQHDVIIKGGKLSEKPRFSGESILFSTDAGQYERYELSQVGAFLTIEYKETIGMALTAQDFGSFSKRPEDPKVEEPIEKEIPVQDTAPEVETPEVDAPIETGVEPELPKKTPAKKRKKAKK